MGDPGRVIKAADWFPATCRARRPPPPPKGGGCPPPQEKARREDPEAKMRGGGGVYERRCRVIADCLSRGSSPHPLPRRVTGEYKEQLLARAKGRREQVRHPPLSGEWCCAFAEIRLLQKPRGFSQPHGISRIVSLRKLPNSSRRRNRGLHGAYVLSHAHSMHRGPSSVPGPSAVPHRGSGVGDPRRGSHPPPPRSFVRGVSESDHPKLFADKDSIGQPRPFLLVFPP